MPRPMRVFVFASQKGGSGKTTLAGHVAVQAELANAGPVATIDTDPQGSLEKWFEARGADRPVYIKAETNQLGGVIARAREQGYRLLVIDTPPAITRSISDVVSHADLVVVPTRPSPHDLRAVGPTVDIAEYHKKPLVFVVNAASARARITADAAVALSQHGTVAPVTLHHRVDYAASMIDGRTVMEVKADGKSAKEVGELWTYLADRIARMDHADQEAGLMPAVQPQSKPSLVSFGSGGNGFGQKAPVFGRRAGQ